MGQWSHEAVAVGERASALVHHLDRGPGGEAASSGTADRAWKPCSVLDPTTIRRVGWDNEDMTTIDLGEMPHPRPTVPSLLDRFWDQLGLATMTALILGAVTTAMVLAAPLVLR